MVYINEKNKRWITQTFKLLSGLCCVLALTFLMSIDTLAAEGVVQANSANIRSSADPGSTILASVLKGDKLTIKEQTQGTDGNTWYKVFIDGKTLGYVRSDLLSTSESVPTSSTSNQNTTPDTSAITPTTDTNSGVNTNVTVNAEGVSSVQPVSGSVTKDQVRVRADNTTSAGIVATIKKDVVFTVNGTKTNAVNETWYLVNYVVNGADITGYIRSDFVTLTGELLPVEEAPAETPETPEETAPEPEVVEPKDYDTRQEEDVWYLIDNIASAKYQISKLITTAQQNAADLITAQKKVSKQNVIIVVLTIVLVVMALGITLLIFKLKDIMDNEGFDSRDVLPRRPRPLDNAPRKPLTRPTGSRPAQGQNRPVHRLDGSKQVHRPDGTRPVQRPDGTRPAGSHPVSSQSRPVQGGSAQRPAGSHPVSGQSRPAQRPDGARPAHTSQPNRTTGEPSAQRIENQTKAHVETRNLEKDSSDPQAWKSKNFMADDDEFEFEFLNWDGEEEHK